MKITIITLLIISVAVSVDIASQKQGNLRSTDDSATLAQVKQNLYVDETVEVSVQTDVEVQTTTTTTTTTVQTSNQKAKFGTMYSTASDVIVAVDFDEEGTFTDVAVILGPMTITGSTNAVTRISDLTQTGFNVDTKEWYYAEAFHQSENINWLAVESGCRTLNNGLYLCAGNGETSCNGTVDFSYGDTFVDPVVFVTQTSVTYDVDGGSDPVDTVLVSTSSTYATVAQALPEMTCKSDGTYEYYLYRQLGCVETFSWVVFENGATTGDQHGYVTKFEFQSTGNDQEIDLSSYPSYSADELYPRMFAKVQGTPPNGETGIHQLRHDQEDNIRITDGEYTNGSDRDTIRLTYNAKTCANDPNSVRAGATVGVMMLTDNAANEDYSITTVTVETDVENVVYDPVYTL